MTSRMRFVVGLSLFSLVLPVFAGCGNGMGVVPVEGTIMLDGQPLVGAEVIFRPADGRPSLGVTDANGKYTLRDDTDMMGALSGKYKVSISTSGEAAQSGSEVGPSGAKVERVTAQYNKQTTLEVDVTSGGGPLDFKLESKPAG
jgi:hypothetical protein